MLQRRLAARGPWAHPSAHELGHNTPAPPRRRSCISHRLYLRRRGLPSPPATLTERLGYGRPGATAIGADWPVRAQYGSREGPARLCLPPVTSRYRGDRQAAESRSARTSPLTYPGPVFPPFLVQHGSEMIWCRRSKPCCRHARYAGVRLRPMSDSMLFPDPYRAVRLSSW